jgi:hypothetical protein
MSAYRRPGGGIGGHKVIKGGKRPFAASAILSVLPREAVIQTFQVGSYWISD